VEWNEAALKGLKLCGFFTHSNENSFGFLKSGELLDQLYNYNKLEGVCTMEFIDKLHY